MPSFEMLPGLRIPSLELPLFEGLLRRLPNTGVGIVLRHVPNLLIRDQAAQPLQREQSRQAYLLAFVIQCRTQSLGSFRMLHARKDFNSGTAGLQLRAG